MFQFSGFAHYCDWSSTSQVSPFGNLRIKSYLLIPEAYRSLSRPSSPLRAKASPVCPFLLSSTLYAFARISMLFINEINLLLLFAQLKGCPYCCLLFQLLFFQYVKERFDQYWVVSMEYGDKSHIWYLMSHVLSSVVIYGVEPYPIVSLLVGQPLWLNSCFLKCQALTLAVNDTSYYSGE